MLYETKIYIEYLNRYVYRLPYNENEIVIYVIFLRFKSQWWIQCKISAQRICRTIHSVYTPSAYEFTSSIYTFHMIKRKIDGLYVYGVRDDQI